MPTLQETKLPRQAKSNNQINVISPYRKGNIWVYDDPDIGVYSEPFVMGSSEVIDFLVGEETNFFDAAISSKPIPKYDARLVKIEVEKGIEGWYQLVKFLKGSYL